jgi:hypothetical protein
MSSSSCLRSAHGRRLPAPTKRASPWTQQAAPIDSSKVAGLRHGLGRRRLQRRGLAPRRGTLRTRPRTVEARRPDDHPSRARERVLLGDGRVLVRRLRRRRRRLLPRYRHMDCDRPEDLCLSLAAPPLPCFPAGRSSVPPSSPSRCGRHRRGRPSPAVARRPPIAISDCFRCNHRSSCEPFRCSSFCSSREPQSG